MKVHFRLGLIAWVLVLIALTMQMFPMVPPARAAGPWYVTSGGNNGNSCLSPGAACATIKGVLTKPGFVAGDTIRVAVGTYLGTGNEVVLVDKNVTLSGGWDNGFTTQNGTSTIDGLGMRRGITVTEGVTVIIERLSIQNGQGGGVFNSGILTLSNSVVRSSLASQGGGINSEGTLTIINSSITDNQSGLEGVVLHKVIPLGALQKVIPSAV